MLLLLVQAEPGVSRLSSSAAAASDNAGQGRWCIASAATDDDAIAAAA
jgi:hypothetical protein